MLPIFLFERRIRVRFSADTVYDRERLLRFNTFYLLRKRVIWIIMAISTLLVTFAFSWQAALGSYPQTVVLCFVLVWVIDIFYIVFYLVLPRFTIKKARSLNAHIEYTFDEYFFKLESDALMQKNAPGIPYSAVEKMMQSKQDIYIFLTGKQCFIVDKAGFTQGSCEGFIDFMLSKGAKLKR